MNASGLQQRVIRQCHDSRCPGCSTSLDRSSVFALDDHLRANPDCRPAVLAAVFAAGYYGPGTGCWQVDCRRCGGTFLEGHPTRRPYCSPCRPLVAAGQRVVARVRRRRTRQPQQCQVCNRVVTGQRDESRTCSNPCRQRAYRQRATVLDPHKEVTPAGIGSDCAPSAER